MIESLETIFKYLWPLCLAYIGYNERDKFNIKNKQESKTSKEDVDKLIDMDNRVSDVKFGKIEADLTRIERKLDQLLDKLII